VPQDFNRSHECALRLIQTTVQKGREKQPNAKVEVWRNLVLIKAKGAAEALSKAAELGNAEQGDDRGTLRLDGVPAVRKFLGVENIGLAHDGVVDGAEITWDLTRCTQREASSWPKTRQRLLRRLQGEIAPYLKAAVPDEVAPNDPPALLEFEWQRSVPHNRRSVDAVGT